MDLSRIEQHYEREARGYPPYHPRMMTIDVGSVRAAHKQGDLK